MSSLNMKTTGLKRNLISNWNFAVRQSAKKIKLCKTAVQNANIKYQEQKEV